VGGVDGDEIVGTKEKEGPSDGILEGRVVVVGMLDRFSDGVWDGLLDGVWDGFSDGVCEGFLDGVWEGLVVVGILDGELDGF